VDLGVGSVLSTTCGFGIHSNPVDHLLPPVMLVGGR
jgi:hypothetical protein